MVVLGEYISGARIPVVKAYRGDVKRIVGGPVLYGDVDKSADSDDLGADTVHARSYVTFFLKRERHAFSIGVIGRSGAAAQGQSRFQECIIYRAALDISAQGRAVGQEIESICTSVHLVESHCRGRCTGGQGCVLDDRVTAVHHPHAQVHHLVSVLRAFGGGGGTYLYHYVGFLGVFAALLSRRLFLAGVQGDKCTDKH